jgi:hypothetical protein
MLRWTRLSARARCAVLALLAALTALPACRPGSSTSTRELGRFQGYADPRTGTLVITMEGASSSRLASAMGPINPDTTPGRGLGTPDTVELATEWVASTDLAGVTSGLGSFQPCGKPGSFCALVTVRSYFATKELHNVFAVLTDISPVTGHMGFAKTAAPTDTQPGTGLVSATYGLWAYPALLDSTRGTVGTGSAPGANAASRVWAFDNLDDSAFTFHGRIMADPVDTTAPGRQAMCGGVATDLDTIANCGECGRTAPGGLACSYAASASSDQGTAVLSSTACLNPNSSVPTACDSADAMALACIDLDADVANCGACGNACGAGNACVNGTCQVGSIACGTTTCPLGSTCGVGDTCVLSTATEVSVGSDFGCATTSDSRVGTPSGFTPNPTYQNNVVCWGNSHISRIGSPNWPLAIPYLVFLDTTSGFTDHGNALWADNYGIASGGAMTVALSNYATDNHPRRAYFFGDNWNYVAGINTLATQLSGGLLHGVAIYPDLNTPSHRVLSWGVDNTYGQIGLASAHPTPAEPIKYPNLALPALGHATVDGQYLTASFVAAGGNTSCVVEEAPYPSNNDGAGQTAGNVACWGQNADGQVTGTAGANVTAPVDVSGVAGATKVSVGVRHSVALLANGNLVFWGDDTSGQFGTTKSTPFTTVTPGRSVDDLSAGADVTCYVSGGTVYCAGRNDRGQLGLGDTLTHTGFTAVPGVSGATMVRASSTSTEDAGSVCARTSGGNVYCWGANQASQLGNGSTADSSSPVQVQLAPL